MVPGLAFGGGAIGFVTGMATHMITNFARQAEQYIGPFEAIGHALISGSTWRSVLIGAVVGAVVGLVLGLGTHRPRDPRPGQNRKG